MPKMPSMDDSQGHKDQPTQEGVRERSSLLDARTLRRSSPWPFKWTLQDNRWYVNKNKRARQDPDRYEETPW